MYFEETNKNLYLYSKCVTFENKSSVWRVYYLTRVGVRDRKQ